MKLATFDHEIHHSYFFYCPACKRPHLVNVTPDGGGCTWSFNGDIEKPTLAPSVLTTLPPGTRQNADPEYVDGLPPDVCHLFVKEGEIQYLGDCTHEFAGKTIQMIDVDDRGFPLKGGAA